MNKRGAIIAMSALFVFVYINIYIVVKSIFDLFGK